MQLGKSLTALILIRLCITTFRLVAPLSIVYLVGCFYAGTSLFLPYLWLYAAAEAFFYFCIFMPRRVRLQKAAEHPPLTPDERKRLFEKCVMSMTPASTLQWFPSLGGRSSSRVQRDNAIAWLLWALFASDLTDSVEEWEEELEHYISIMVKVLGYPLDKGSNPHLQCMRLTLDPVIMVHRPLLWYMIVGLVDTITTVSLFVQGFRHFDTPTWFRVFPPRPLLALFSNTSADPRVPYWYRPHRSTTKHPILFIHGIGIGLWLYLSFLREVIEQDPDVGILAVEILPVSMRITDPPLPKDAMCAAIARILDAHGLERIVIASHSYGTVVTAHLLQSPALAPRIAAMLLIDPIPFLLHHANVAYNFVYRAPRDANHWGLWYFGSRDADIARALSRHFFWHENILFKEDLENRRVAVVLSGEDQIVDTHAVGKYLTGEPEPPLRWKEDGVQVLFFPKLDHGQVLDTKERRKELLSILHGFVRSE